MTGLAGAACCWPPADDVGAAPAAGSPPRGSLAARRLGGASPSPSPSSLSGEPPASSPLVVGLRLRTGRPEAAAAAATAASGACAASAGPAAAASGAAVTPTVAGAVWGAALRLGGGAAAIAAPTSSAAAASPSPAGGPPGRPPSGRGSAEVCMVARLAGGLRWAQGRAGGPSSAEIAAASAGGWAGGELDAQSLQPGESALVSGIASLGVNGTPGGGAGERGPTQTKCWTPPRPCSGGYSPAPLLVEIWTSYIAA